MPWFKVDDNLAFHQKTLRAGNAAMGLWVRAGSWCAQQLTDGFVPTDMARTLGSAAEAKRLVNASLWLERDDGYEFWQWAEDGRQPTRAEVEVKRKDARDRQQRAREARAVSRRESQRDIPRESQRDTTRSNSGSHASPDPTRPDPTRREGSDEPSRPRKRGTRLPDEWQPKPELVDWQRENGVSDLLARRELPKFRDYWRGKAGQQGVKLDWDGTWRNWLRIALEREPQRDRLPTTPWMGA